MKQGCAEEKLALNQADPEFYLAKKKGSGLSRLGQWLCYVAKLQVDLGSCPRGPIEYDLI